MSKQYETVIGLEVHVELATKTKIFCSCSTAFGGAPNTHTCPVCTGMPGSLPVLNKKVVEYAMAVGLATNCTITRHSKFDRYQYHYAFCSVDYFTFANFRLGFRVACCRNNDFLLCRIYDFQRDFYHCFLCKSKRAEQFDES